MAFTTVNGHFTVEHHKNWYIAD